MYKRIRLNDNVKCQYHEHIYISCELLRPLCSSLYVKYECLQATIWMLWTSSYYDLCMYPYCECPQTVNYVRLQAISVRFEDVGCTCHHIARVSRLWTLSISILWSVYVSMFRTSSGWALSVFRWATKLKLSASRVSRYNHNYTCNVTDWKTQEKVIYLFYL